MKPLFADAKIVDSTPDSRPLAEPPSVSPLVPLDAFSAQALAPAQAVRAVAPVTSATVPAPRYDEDQIAQLGQQAGSGVASVSSSLVSTVKTSETGEFGTGLNQLVVLAKGLDPAALKNKGVFGRIKGLISNAKEQLVAQYATVEKQIDTLTVVLDQKAALHRKRIGDMDRMYDDNEAYHNQLGQAVALGNQTLVAMQADFEAAKRIAVNDSFGAQRLADHERIIDRLSKRIDDLGRAMLLAKQAAPQIRLMQENSRALVQKFGDVKAVTLPAWKNTFALYVLQLEQQESVKVLDAVDQTTEEALRRNADLLRQNTEAIATARQRSVVTIETLEHVQTQLLGSIEDVKRIEAEGKQRRAAEQPKLLEMERSLIAAFAPKSNH